MWVSRVCMGYWGFVGLVVVEGTKDGGIRMLVFMIEEELQKCGSL